MNRPRFDIGQIIRDWGEEFFSQKSRPYHVKKAFGAIAACRTKALGGHVEVCPECGERHISYNSCRDRNCLKCQHKDREIWIDKRKEEVIPKVTYFHVVFTVPECLNQIALSNQPIFYSCMFRSAWNTLKKFFAEKKLQGGMTSILHTWGSNLSFHPHIHCIVTGGGIDSKDVWHHLKGCGKKSGNYLFPVQALSKVYRAKFLAMLTSELKTQEKPIPQSVRKECMSKAWVVYSRPPAKGVNKVIDYIGRYAYRVAITNSRILHYSVDGTLEYNWKNYRNGGKHSRTKMHAIDFLNLFSIHILPDSLVRIRHYGLLSPRNRDKLRKVQIQMGGTPVPKERKTKSYMEICIEKGWDIGLCLNCGTLMEVKEVIPPTRAPPIWRNKKNTTHC